MPQRVLLGNLPGFVHSHDLFPQAGDLFWSPADWAWTGGLMDALLPSLYHGTPVLGYRGRFDPDRSFWLRSEEHTSELQSLTNLVCRLLLEKKTNIVTAA